MSKPISKRGRHQLLTLWLSGCAALFFFGISHAETTETPPLIPISIIIDDLGDLHQNGLRTTRLPGRITCAFLPHSPYSKSLALTAHGLGKEVMIHMPMEAMEERRLAPGSLKLEMTEQEFKRTLKAGIESIPYASGLNNHMGSLLTRHPGHMQWLMETLKENGQLFFIDSRTTPQTVALQLARENQIPTRQRDIFLDDDATPAAIAYQFNRLVKQAKKRGGAIAIGHPHDSTLDLLEQQLPRLQSLGLKLVPVSELLKTSRQPEQHLAHDTESNDAAERLVYNNSSSTSPRHPKLTQ